MPTFFTTRRTAWLLAAVFVVCGAGGAALFPRSFPILALDQRLTGPLAEQRADSFALAHGLPRTGERVATRFGGDNALQVFLDFTGGADTVRALSRGTDHALYSWTVRRFTAGDAHETRITMAPDGRVIGFYRKLADADTLPAIAPDSAQRLAETVRDRWLGEPANRWRLASSSYEAKPVSGRIDRTFTFERTDRRVLGAPLRLKIVIGGNTPVLAYRSVEIPEKFERRYAEMRASNNLFATYSSIGQLLLALAAVFALRRFARDGGVRWRPALMVGAVVGVLMTGAALNELPSSWFDYDTATSPMTFMAMALVGAVASGVFVTLLIGLTLAAAEAATRRADPAQLDWWRWWQARGTRQVAGRVLGGYAFATFGVLYVSVFYIVTRKYFGWWTPTEMLDDPNQIATQLPWLAGLANSLQAGIWEEAMFRVLPLSLLAIWARDREHRMRWMAAGVVGTALVFGFAHATYTSWPAYSRGVELLLESSLWAVIVIVFGPLTTMIGHFLFDFLLFSLFAAAGSAPSYRVTAAVAVLGLLAPALVVAWKVWQQRGLTDVTEADSFGAWRAEPEAEMEQPTSIIALRAITPRARTWALSLGVLGLALSVAAPKRPVRGPALTTTRAVAEHVADSALALRGVPVAGWTHLSRVAEDTMDTWPRFLKAQRAESLATQLAITYHPAAWWVVRYVHIHGENETRAEEWRVRVWPDGRVMDIRHILPDAAWRDSVTADEARRLARVAMAAAHFDTTKFAEAKLVADQRAADSTKAQRKDVTITYTDTTLHLPGDALARAWVAVAGNEVTLVRRGIELPESFVRADRKRRSTIMAVGAGVGVLMFGFIVGGAVYVRGRRKNLIEDRPATRPRIWIALSVLAVLQLATSINGLPATLAGYDTAERWRSFVSTTGLSTVMSLALVAFLAGVWTAFDGLRRRVGIPFFARGSDAWSTTLIAGLGLAGARATFAGVMPWISTARIPDAPVEGVLLGNAIPALALPLSVPATILMSVAVSAIIAFVFLLITQSNAKRVGLLLAFGALGGAFSLTTDGGGNLTHPALAAGVAVLAIIGFFMALRAFALTSAMAWMVSAILGIAYEGTRQVMAPGVTELRLSGALGLVVSALLLLAARRLLVLESQGGAP